ncbi:MAG: type II secretion system GspH family protein, partial [Coriobacteriales bacterium]|nr:type II secretion system GspH family protein [Coriobacteriales bacterium]
MYPRFRHEQIGASTTNVREGKKRACKVISSYTQISGWGGYLFPSSLIPSITTPPKSACQQPLEAAFLCPHTKKAVLAWIPPTEAPRTGGAALGAGLGRTWAPRTENTSSNTLRPRRLSSSTSPATPQPGSSVCKTHRACPVRGATQRRAGSVSFRSLCSSAKERAGFTLVELIVVIVILGILLAIAVPALTGYIGKAGSVKKEADLNTSVKAIQTWAVERLAQNLIGHSALVIPDAASLLKNASDPIDPTSYGGTSDEATWEGIVATLSKLDLRTTDWRLVNVTFDTTNKLLSLRIINTKDTHDFADYGQPPVPYTLSYSEGAVMLGSATGSGGFTGLASTSYTINLTSPIGWPTVRYFSTSDASVTWSLDAGTTGATLSGTGATRAVSIPVGATGTATLTSDAYTITFSVQANRAPSPTLKRGDTFYASGFDWRILYKASNTDALVIAEHIIDTKRISVTYTNWDINIRWDGSQLRTALNNNAYTYSYDNLTDIKAK